MPDAAKQIAVRQRMRIPDGLVAAVIPDHLSVRIHGQREAVLVVRFAAGGPFHGSKKRHARLHPLGTANTALIGGKSSGNGEVSNSSS